MTVSKALQDERNRRQHFELEVDRLEAKIWRLKLYIVGCIMFVGVASYQLFQAHRLLTEMDSALTDARGAVETAMQSGILVWQMDRSCLNQLKSASMVQLKLLE